ncbi:hypothetical protein J6590_094825 [Homalodisca vitripennis]|nr:hypothetical protein J6590_094825 [Homalodisca vitripennis]
MSIPTTDQGGSWLPAADGSGLLIATSSNWVTRQISEISFETSFRSDSVDLPFHLPFRSRSRQLPPSARPARQGAGRGGSEGGGGACAWRATCRNQVPEVDPYVPEMIVKDQVLRARPACAP